MEHKVVSDYSRDSLSDNTHVKVTHLLLNFDALLAFRCVCVSGHVQMVKLAPKHSCREARTRLASLRLRCVLYFIKSAISVIKS